MGQSASCEGRNGRGLCACQTNTFRATTAAPKEVDLGFATASVGD